MSHLSKNFACVDTGACVGCGLCAKECPASVISILPRGPQENKSVHTGGNRHE